MAARKSRPAYARGVQASLRRNATAYEYSVMITASLAALATVLGPPGVGEVFGFIGGAVAGFALVEAVVTRGFRHRLEDEPAKAVVIGSALGFASVGAGLGVAVLCAELLGDAGWPVGAMLGTITYLLIVGVEMTLGERASAGQ